MRGHDQNHGKGQQKQFIIVPVLFGQQEEHTGGKKHKRNIAPVMLHKTMTQSQQSHQECKKDHTIFKITVVDDIDAQQGETTQKKR